MAMTTYYLYYLLFYFFKNAENFKLKIIICERKYWLFKNILFVEMKIFKFD
jgi:hypothetical protein